MTYEADRHEHVFIVRVWLDTGRVEPSQWRGSVEHVPSGHRRYFAALAELTEFIAWRREQPLQPPIRPAEGD